jgi:transcriptional regulator of arginine metabolism
MYIDSFLCISMQANGVPVKTAGTRISNPAMKSRRHAAIRSLIAANEIYSQHELAQLLARDGIEATQATLSRDLSELGVLKGPDGYQLPGATAAAPAPDAALARALRRELISISVGGTLVVLKTPTIELDRMRMQGVLGTIAGDDTVFLAASTPLAARRIAKDLRALAQIA